MLKRNVRKWHSTFFMHVGMIPVVCAVIILWNGCRTHSIWNTVEPYYSCDNQNRKLQFVMNLTAIFYGKKVVPICCVFTSTSSPYRPNMMGFWAMQELQFNVQGHFIVTVKRLINQPCLDLSHENVDARFLETQTCGKFKREVEIRVTYVMWLCVDLERSVILI